MTQEDKELLLIDLCARLPYGVKVSIDNKIYPIKSVDIYEEIGLVDYTNDLYIFDDIKPYLRPMSSMTEEEKKELWLALDKDMDIIENNLDAPIINVYKGRVYRGNPIHYELDFLLSHHFDYRGLIEKGLALEAPEDIYNTKTK